MAEMKKQDRDEAATPTWLATAGEIIAACEHGTDGTILRCSSRLAKLLGHRSAAELHGGDLFSFYVNPSDPAHLLSLLDVDVMSEPVDICMRRLDGRLIWVLQVCGYASVVGRPVVVSTFMDITDRKVAELLDAERSEAEAILSRAVTDELMATSNVGELISTFRTAGTRSPSMQALPEDHTSLSPRELRVLIMTGQGSSLKEIATELGISLKSVSTYRTRIMTKLELKSSADMVAYVVRRRLR